MRILRKYKGECKGKLGFFRGTQSDYIGIAKGFAQITKGNTKEMLRVFEEMQRGMQRKC